MREFAKWWVKQFKSDPKEIHGALAREICKITAKSWRAALEEVLKQISYKPDGSIVNWIKKELEDETS